MKKISYWAKSNLFFARSIIVICHLLLFLIAIFIGNTTSNEGIYLPGYLLLISTVLFITAGINYPDKQEKKVLVINNYFRRKCCDFIIVFSGFIMLCISINHLNTQGIAAEPVFSAIIHPVPDGKNVTAQEIFASGKKGSQLNRQEKKILKVEFRRQIKNWIRAKLSGDKSEEGNAALIIFVLIGALGLTALLSGLVCNLSCSGSAGAAALVGIVGFAGIVWLTTFLIKRINHPRHPVQKNDDTPIEVKPIINN